MDKIQVDLEFGGESRQGLEERFRLSTWAQGTWVSRGDCLSQTRDRLAETRRRQEYLRDVYGGGPSWITLPRAPWPALALGDRHWRDYTVSAVLSPTAAGGCGIGFRWVDARHYYLLVLEEQQRLSLYRRCEDDLILLASRPFLHELGQRYELRATVSAAHLACAVGNQSLLDLADAAYPRGGVGLVADVPCDYFRLRVEGTRDAAELRPLPAGQHPVEELRIPLVCPDASATCVVRFHPLNGVPHLTLVNQAEHTLTILDPQGKTVTRLGPWKRALGCTGDLPFQFFDLNGDGRDELVIAADFTIRVYQPLTGELLAEVPCPAANHYGEDRDNRDALVAGDALCPVQLAAGQPPGFYLKDRYWNLYLYDHRLRLLWHKPMRTGHFPLPFDADGDGRDEILAGPCLLTAGGRELWSLPLYDHFDSIGWLALTPGAPRSLYVASGEEGLVKIDATRGELLAQRKWGHVQSFCAGQFLPDRNDRQLLVNTLWREPGIHVLADADCREISRWESGFGKCCPLPWGEHDLLLTRAGLVDPLTGDLQCALPALADSLAMTVLDWPATGPGRLAVVRPGELVLYGPANGDVRHACPLPRIQSNYLPQAFSG